MSEPKYPQVVVPMIGEDGNALAIIGRATQAARKVGLTQEQIDEYWQEAMSGNYDNLLRVTMKYFEVE